MIRSRIGRWIAETGIVIAFVLAYAAPVRSDAREWIRIPLGRAEVLNLDDEVRTVAIAEPKIADAAVGSARTVIINARATGITTLVVYAEGARYRVYDVDVYVPNQEKQVKLSVRVAEVNDNAVRELGFDLYGEGTANIRWLDGFIKGGLLTGKIAPVALDQETRTVGGLSVGTGTDGFLGYARNNSDVVLQATWRALEERGDLRTLATPTLVTRSGQDASFLAGGEIPVPVASAAASGGTSINIQWKEFGVRLGFTPLVEEDGSITVKVAPELSQLDYSNSLVLEGFSVPALVSRKASTTVNLKAGEHLAIGGLKQVEQVKVVRRVPLLGRIPLLGLFFSNTRTEQVQRDLLVVVSPEIVERADTELPALPTDR